MSKVVGVVVGAAETAIGIVTGNPLLIVQGVATIGTTLLAPSGPKKQERQASVTSLTLGEGPREALFGTAVTAGSLVDAFNYGGQFNDDWEVLVIDVADHRTDALLGAFVNDAYVAYAGDGPVAGYNGQLEIYYRNGTETQTVPSILTAHGPGWTANDNGAGVSYVVVAYKADAQDAKNPVWPAGRPSFLWHLRGARCYIPRKDGTLAGGSGAHRRDDPTTWEWTDNLIDCRYNWVRGLYACDRVTDPTMLLVGRGLTATEAPPENSFAPANLCDEVLAGGNKRYAIGGVVMADQPYIDVEEEFAIACGGIIVQPEGSVEIEPGQAKAPVFTFTDDDLIVGSKVEGKDFLSRADSDWVNTIIPRYVEPSLKWADHAAAIRRVDADVIADGGSREATLSMALVTVEEQAGRVGEIARRLGRLWKRYTVTLGPAFCGVEEGDWGVWTSETYLKGASITFRVESYSLDEKWQNTLVLREIGASCYTDAAFVASQASAAQQGAVDRLAAPGASAWALTAEQLSTGGAEMPALVIAGAVDYPYAQAVRFEYWRSDGVTDPAAVAAWTGATMASPGVVRHEITSIAPDAVYYAAISYVVNGVPGNRRILGPVTAGALRAQGANNATLYIYKRSATPPSLPSATTTYTFATGALSALDNGWTQAVPAGTDPLYVSSAYATSPTPTDTIAPGEWAGAVVLARDGAAGATGATGTAGANGINSAAVFLYQRNDTGTAPSLPSATTTYTFATGALTGVDNGWLRAVPDNSAGKFLFVTQATALGTGATDTIAATEWASVAVMVQDGAVGATGATGATGAAGAPGLNNATVFIFQRAASAPSLPNATTTYDFAAKTLTGLDNGWSLTVPARDGNPLFVSAATASGSGATDTIAAGEWAAPVIQAQDGAAGSTGSTGAPGANGLNTATVFLYQRNGTGSFPAAPSVTTTYTFAGATLSGINNGWTQSVPDASLGKFLFVTTATALGTGATDTIAAGEWASVAILAQDGATGSTGSTGATGSTGTPGQDAVTLDFQKHSIGVAADYNGVVRTPLPISNKATLMSGLTDVSASASWSISAQNGATATIDASGNISLTGVTALNGTITVSAVYLGVTFTKAFGTIRSDDPLPPQTAGSISDSGAVNVSGTTYPSTPTSGIWTVKADAGGNLIFDVTGDAPISSTSGTKTVTIAVKGAYRVAGSGAAWTDIAAGEGQGSGSAIPGEPGEAMAFVSATQTGLTAGGSYEVVMFARRVSGTLTLVTVDWTLNVRNS